MLCHQIGCVVFLCISAEVELEQRPGDVVILNPLHLVDITDTVHVTKSNVCANTHTSQVNITFLYCLPPSPFNRYKAPNLKVINDWP